MVATPNGVRYYRDLFKYYARDDRYSGRFVITYFYASFRIVSIPVTSCVSRLRNLPDRKYNQFILHTLSALSLQTQLDWRLSNHELLLYESHSSTKCWYFASSNITRWRKKDDMIRACGVDSCCFGSNTRTPDIPNTLTSVADCV